MITKAKDLCSYVLLVTDKAPKHFRYTFTNRLQNMALDIIRRLYRANRVFVSPGDREAFARRKEFQAEALTDIDLLCYLAELAMTQKCILPRQYEQISLLAAEARHYLAAWVNGDKRRFQP